MANDQPGQIIDDLPTHKDILQPNSQVSHFGGVGRWNYEAIFLN